MQRRSWILSIFLCTAGWLSAGSAQADTRCQGKLVSEGDPQYQVRNLCGSPDQATQRVELRTVRNTVLVPCGRGLCNQVVEQTVQVVIEEWVYDLGPNNLIRFLAFEQGRLFRITTGGYGTKVL